TSPRNGLKPLKPMPQVRPQRRLGGGRKRDLHPNRHGRLVVAVRQLQVRLVGPRLAALVQGVVDLHIGVRVQGRNLHVAVRALEVVAVQVQLPLNTPTLGGAFVGIRRPKSGADVVPPKARNRLIGVHAKGHYSCASTTGRHSQVCFSLSKNGSIRVPGGGGGTGTAVEPWVSVSM